MAPTTLDLAPATPASSSATPTTRRSLPRYKGRQIDNTDLLDSIDQVGTKLAETLALVDSIQNQPTEQVTTTHNRSTQPARASRPAQLGMDLMVTSTPEGRSVRHHLVHSLRSLPRGMPKVVDYQQTGAQVTNEMVMN